MAEPTAVTGSIGVIMQSVEFSGTLAKIGVTTDAIKSGANKDAGSPLTPMTPAQRQIFQTMIDGMYARFVDVVDTGRPKLDRQRVLELADGRVYTAPQALEAGLIDRVGTLRDAISRAKELAGVAHCRVVSYERPGSWHPNIYALSDVGADAGPAHVSLLGFDWPSWLRPGGAQFMYLWLPGS
jgi:protease-4